MRRRVSAKSGLRLIQTRSLADQIADFIVEGIATGTIRPGQRIAEVELAKRLGVPAACRSEKPSKSSGRRVSW